MAITCGHWRQELPKKKLATLVMSRSVDLPTRTLQWYDIPDIHVTKKQFLVTIWLYIHIHVYTHTHICMYVYIYTSIHTHIHTNCFCKHVTEFIQSWTNPLGLWRTTIEHELDSSDIPPQDLVRDVVIGYTGDEDEDPPQARCVWSIFI